MAAWTKTRDVFLEQNIQNTNILYGPIGMGVPVSSKEYNINFLLRSQADQDIYRSMAPSGFVTRILPISALETTLTLDADGELVALTTNSVFLANRLRLGRVNVCVNGWKIRVSNTAGTSGLHNDVVVDAPPVAGGRTDLMFLEVWLAELGGTSASISNTGNKPDATHLYQFGNTQFNGTNAVDDISELDAEINRRWQIQYRIRVVNGIDLDTFPDGVDNQAVVKAWGTNPAGTWSGFAAGTGSVYTFSNMNVTMSDSGLYRAGDGSAAAKSSLGTVDGYVYAIPLAAIFRRNSGIYDAGTNPLGCAAAGPTGGTIASGVSGRPDGFFCDQVDAGDIIGLRHQVFIDTSFEPLNLLTECMDRAMRGNLTSSFGRGDGSGAPAAGRSTHTLYAQELSTAGALDAGFKGFAQYNFQRRIFSDAAVTQQTQFTYTGGTAPDNAKPTILAPPATPTGSSSTASGTLGAGSYAAKITYVNAFGESLPSAESATLTLGSNGTVTINSPVTSGNATGWNAYITSTPGSAWKKQNGSPVSIGVNYAQSAPLNGAGAVPPIANTTSSTLVITADSSGLVTGTAKVVCVDGTATSGAGSLPGSVNILVYDASTFAAVPGSWATLNTATSTFTPTSPWSASVQANGCVAVVGLAYPAGNGMTFRSNGVVAQTLIQGGTTTSLGQIGVSGTSGADNAHLSTPKGIFVDTSGNIWVADSANHRVIKYNSSLVYQTQFGATGISGADNTHLNSPQSVLVDNSGNIYISDSLNHRIVKLNSSLSYVSQFGVTAVSGSDNSHLNSPLQIAFDTAQSNIYIADQLNNRIIRITIALAFGALFATTTANPSGIVLDASSNVYVTLANHILQKYTSGGATSIAFGTAASAGSGNYLLNTPRHVAIDANNNILVADSNNHRIALINPNMICVGQFGVGNTGAAPRFGSDKAHLNVCEGVTLDAAGLWYVGDSANQRVLKLHKEMGASDPPLRQFEVAYSGVSTDRLKIWYNYRPYQGIIGFQGNTTMNYKFRALTDINSFVTTLGTGGRNALTEDNLNGFIVRMPFPLTFFGETPGTDTEYVEAGTSLTSGGSDSAALISGLSTAWGGSMGTFGSSSNPSGLMMGPLLSGNTVQIAQNSASSFPNRGVNAISRFVDNLVINNGFDTLGMSFGIVNSTDHLTVGYFLATASGGPSVLPLIPGEMVMIVVSYRVNGTAAALYGNTSSSVAVDVFRLPSKPLIRF
jgi:hypothetical protein